ncbi:hypothetical protein BDM02DRAFT_3110588, partial [Thelephora ganbajun]
MVPVLHATSHETPVCPTKWEMTDRERRLVGRVELYTSFSEGRTEYPYGDSTHSIVQLFYPLRRKVEASGIRYSGVI